MGVGEPLDHAVDLLVERAQTAGVIRADVRTADVRVLLSTLHLAAERIADDPTAVPRLLNIIQGGLRPTT